MLSTLCVKRKCSWYLCYVSIFTLALRANYPSARFPALGGKDSHIKWTGVLVRNFEKEEPLGVPKPCFVGVAWIFFFPPLSGTNSIATHELTLTNRGGELYPVDLLRLNTKRTNKSAFLTQKRYVEPPPSFFVWESPPPGFQHIKQTHIW